MGGKAGASWRIEACGRDEETCSTEAAGAVGSSCSLAAGSEFLEEISTIIFDLPWLAGDCPSS